MKNSIDIKNFNAKSIYIIVSVIVIFFALYFYCFVSQGKMLAITENVVKIRVCKVIEHEALNSVIFGMTDYLNSRAKEENNKAKKYDISVETCQGNMALASQIIAKFASDPSTSIVVTIGTIPSQAAYKFSKSGKIKVVFSSVTNPKDIADEFSDSNITGISETNLKDTSEEFSGSNMTGVSNFVALRPQLELFRKIQPSLKKLGILFNVGEANSVYIVNSLKPICADMGIELIEQGISKISELPQVTEKLAERVDAIFISNDNMALSGMDNIVSICKKRGIPVYVSDTDQVEKGCSAAFGPNQYDIGVQTGKVIEKIVEGANINEIPIQYPDTTEFYVNTKGMVEIPQDIKDKAKLVF